jgi:hypothetical protein
MHWNERVGTKESQFNVDVVMAIPVAQINLII